MNDHKVSVAVFGIITNDAGEILFQKRQNTGFADGCYQLPSGHLDTDPAESVADGCIRELHEEIGIEVSLENINLRFSHHSCGLGTKNYLGFFFDILKYSGNIINAEPEKCELLEWIHPRDFSDKRIVKYVKENLLDNTSGVFRAQEYLESKDFTG